MFFTNFNFIILAFKKIFFILAPLFNIHSLGVSGSHILGVGAVVAEVVDVVIVGHVLGVGDVVRVGVVAVAGW